MLQQSFNFLLKQFKRAQAGKDVVFPYLKEIDANLSKKLEVRAGVNPFENIDIVEEAMKVQVSYGLKKLMVKMEKSEASKKDQINSLYALDIVKVATDHMRLQIFLMSRDGYKELKCGQNRKNCELLCLLLGLNFLHLDGKNCLESGYFQPGIMSDLILDAIKDTNRKLRPNALNIIESFEIPDQFLQSAIGNSYGDIYEQHLEWAKNNRLNDTKQGDAIPDGFLEYMMPILKAKM